MINSLFVLVETPVPEVRHKDRFGRSAEMSKPDVAEGYGDRWVEVVGRFGASRGDHDRSDPTAASVPITTVTQA
jgi:hypothetical protein